MGRLVQGEWFDEGYHTERHGGAFVREDAGFRDWVTADGARGPHGEPAVPSASGRYHLYVSLACPWASRALLMRRVKGLEDVVGVSVTHPHMLADGWSFDSDWPGASGDRLYGERFLRDLYVRAKPDYTGRVTVPALWDRDRETIISNESADIIRMLNAAFEAFTDRHTDFYPPDLRAEIDAVNARVYGYVNNGVYRAGFATTQSAYEQAFEALFEVLDDLDGRLVERRFLLGSVLTEADWRLFTTLVRFDAVYHGHFKCNLRRIADYPALAGYLRDLYQYPGVRRTVDLDHIKQHYYYSHGQVNPTRIVPLGPALDLDAPHERERLGAIELRQHG